MNYKLTVTKSKHSTCFYIQTTGSLSLWARNCLEKFFNELLHSSLFFATFVRKCTYKGKIACILDS